MVLPLAVAGGFTLVTPTVGAAGLPGETPSAPMLVVLVGPNGSIVRGSGGLPRPGLLVGVLADPIAWP